MLYSMTPLWLLNIGSFLLGATLAIVILALWGSRIGGLNSAESCLISLVCFFGVSLSVLLYSAAVLA